ncbi:MAG TPA: RNase adapter RapZ, partial [Steroidobacteraceae bacterium]
YWEPHLRQLSGRDAPVIKFLESQDAVPRYLDDIEKLVRARIPEHQASNRRYVTIAVGCTGGQHRSVYLVDRLAERFASHDPHITVRHSTLQSAVHAEDAARA